MSYTYSYPRPAVTVDCVVFGSGAGPLKVLLIRRLKEPFQGKWALPGGFVDMEEGLEEAARRELREETGLSRIDLEQLGAFGEPERDPRGRVISVAYWGLIRLDEHRVSADSDAGEVDWFPATDPPELAFDHHDILERALARLSEKGALHAEPRAGTSSI